MRRVEVAVAHGHRSRAAAAASLALLSSVRGYFWPYSENFVPEDAKPSSFQASPVPSVRENIIREYALGPLFGARTPLCVLGFFPPPPSPLSGSSPSTAPDRTEAYKSPRALAMSLIERKKALRVALAELLSCDVKDVELGQVNMAKEMMMYRHGTAESPRLKDGPGACADATSLRRQRYARKPIAARALLDVYVSDNVFETPEEKGVFAAFVQERIAAHHEEARTFDETRAAFAQKLQEEKTQPVAAASPPADTSKPATTPAKWSAQQREAFENDMEERARVLDSVADLLELGVVYCEVPAKAEDVDGHDYTFDKLHGKELDLETAEQVLDRWDARLQA